MGFGVAMTFGLGLFDQVQHFFVGFGNDAGNTALRIFPVFQETAAQLAARILDMAAEKLLNGSGFCVVAQGFQPDQFLVAVGRFQIVYIGDTAGHAGSKVAACTAQDEHLAACHVFTAMVAYAFDDGFHAAVTDTEAFAGHAVDVGFPARSTIEGHVADNDVVFCREG